jgi:ATP-binding cassette subfamily B protein
MVVLQLFNREKRAYEKFERINATHMDAFKDAIMAHAVYYPVVEILSAIAIASVIWFGGHQVLGGAVQLGTLVAFIQYAQRFFRPIQDLSEKYNILQAAMASSERVFKLLDTQVEIASPERPRKPVGSGRIEFDRVWFAYRSVPLDGGSNGATPETLQSPASPRHGALEEVARAHEGHPGEPDWVLCDVSFDIEPGETVAIVGHTGAGKTTILSLLLRFYDVQRGAIRIDGVDIRDLDLHDLRRRFGMVLQDPFLFTGTMEQNIRLGSNWINDEAVERAAEEVNVADFIRTLPNGFREPVRERGSTLSTGQKQLVSFARALAHSPKILVLDEATSSVDTETEFRVRDALSRMIGAQGRTSIVVAHRLSTVQRADKIIVMHKGRVREIGTHQQLLSKRGIYWRLYQLQYKDQEIGGSPLPTGGDDTSHIPVGADD